MRIKLTTALLLALLSSPASAGYTGKDLLGFCQSTEPFSKGLCVGVVSSSINAYLQGSRLTAHSLISSIARNAGKGPAEANDDASKTLLNPEMFILFNGYCPQESLTQGQINDIIFKYLRDNPTELARPAELVIINAMGAAYPVQGCTWQPPKKAGR